MIKEYSISVYLNTPFDKEYKEMLYSIVYTICKCGFIPRSALEDDNALNPRLSKTTTIIGDCKFSIHDISLTETSEGEPRHNMSFELGMIFGATTFGDPLHRNKVALILEKQKYLSQRYISDLNGVDIKAHNQEPAKAIKIVRDWLKISSGKLEMDGHVSLQKDYQNFRKNVLPKVVKKLWLDINDLTFNDYCLIVEEYITA